MEYKVKELKIPLDDIVAVIFTCGKCGKKHKQLFKSLEDLEVPEEWIIAPKRKKMFCCEKCFIGYLAKNGERRNP